MVGEVSGVEDVVGDGVVNVIRLCPSPLWPGPGLGVRKVIEDIEGGVTGAYAGTGDIDLDLICAGELGSDRNRLEEDGEEGNEAGDEEEGENISFIRRFFIAMRMRILALRLGLGLGLELGVFIGVATGVNLFDIEIGVEGSARLDPCSSCSPSNRPWRSLVPLLALRRSTPQRARKRARHTVLSRASVRHVRETLQQASSVASAVWAVSRSCGIGRWVEVIESRG